MHLDGRSRGPSVVPAGTRCKAIGRAVEDETLIQSDEREDSAKRNPQNRETTDRKDLANVVVFARPPGLR